METPHIWVLTDDKPGNSTQSLGVAACLPWPFEQKKLTLNRWADLPNQLLGRSRLSLSAAKSDMIKAPWPDIAIAAGRRLVPVLRYIKKRNPSCFTVYLMRPGKGISFDLLAIPQHDKPKLKPNIIATLGAPHAVTEEKLNNAAREWLPQLEHLQKPYVAVLAGGNSSSAQYELEDFHDLGVLASEMANREQGALLVTTSRRTGTRYTDYLRLALAADHELFTWKQESPNPYHAFLGLADAIIVTGDSMSMCAEACSTGKPVFIYIPRRGKLAPKLRDLHEALFEQGLAQPLTANASYQWKPSIPLNEAGRIAQEIIRRYSNN